MTGNRNGAHTPDASSAVAGQPRTQELLFARWVGLAASTFCLALAGCATLADGNRGPSDDPLEPLNRVVLDTNTALDNAFIRPAAEIYRQIVPPFVRDAIRSAIDNLAEPRILVNNLLQGRAAAAETTFVRFFLNTTIGVAGLSDFATGQGFPKQSGDFGQTLYTWGVPDGPYLVLLFFGPSDLRDAFGLGVDLYTTPPALVVTGRAGVVTNMVVGTVDGMDLRSRNIESLDEIVASALDYYSNLKSIMQQRRRAQLLEARGIRAEPQELVDPGTAETEPRK
jgi:phospholipid-binding lipoprotein MlaA